MTPEYLAKNPQHNIPFVEDGDLGLTESRNGINSIELVVFASLDDLVLFADATTAIFLVQTLIIIFIGSESRSSI